MTVLLAQIEQRDGWVLVEKGTGRVIAYMRTPLETLDPTLRRCVYGHVDCGGWCCERPQSLAA